MNKKWTTESFSKKVKEISNEYELISEYTSSHKHVTLLHSKCGKSYNVTPTNFLRKIGWCSYCAQEKRNKALRKTLEDFKKEIQNLDSDYNVIGDYAGTNIKTTFIHKSCGRYFEMTPSNFLQGQRCPHCNSAELKRHSAHTVQNIITKKLDSSYKLISEYKNNHTKINVFHEKCNNIWETTLRGINSGNRCPFCTTMSKGEERIFCFLREHNINAIYQKRFDDCRRVESLPFDFYIESHNLLIEYDGIFHYEPIYGEEKLIQQKENDNKKTKYAVENQFELLRVSYWDFDKIEDILRKVLNC